MIKLLAIDMDGTCLNDKKQISDENLTALKAAADAGIIIVPTTGRTLSCLPHRLKKEQFYRYVISSNGACVTDTYENKDLYKAEIPYQTAAGLLEKFKGLKTGITAHINHEFIVEGHILRAIGKLSYGKDANKSLYSKSIADYLDSKKENVEELQIFYFNEESEKQTKEILSGCTQILKSFSKNYVELYSEKASKGNSVAALAASLGIDTSETACIGDAENDLSMFSVCGMKLAMGNSIAALKDKADHILPSNNDSGVAYAINSYLLRI